jgi:hypothetical protein
MGTHRVARIVVALSLAAMLAPQVADAATVEGIVDDSARTWIKLGGVTYHVVPGEDLETQGGERIDPRELPPGTHAFLDLDDRGRVVAIRPSILR